MNSRRFFLVLASLLPLVVFGCFAEPEAGDDSLAIELRWVRSYPTERRSDVETGLLWTLSLLGAALSRDEPSPLIWRGDTIALSLETAGIDSAVLRNWRRLFTVLKASEEYQRRGGIDIGRFVALTLCSSHHYYLLTGASSSYEQVRERYDFDPQLAAIVESSVAVGNRLIEISRGDTADELAFVAHEGTGSVQQGSFRPVEHELLTVMANGQLRFALYDTSGSIKPAASDAVTTAGKPAKCLWCHESQLSRPFVGRTSVAGYYSPAGFERQVANKDEILRRARAGLRSRIDFGHGQDHTYAELLYLSFYEPSAERLANEWGVPVEQAEQLLEDFPSHANDEFEFLGNKLYSRSQIDTLSPYDVIEVPTDPREPSLYEPNLLR